MPSSPSASSLSPGRATAPDDLALDRGAATLRRFLPWLIAAAVIAGAWLWWRQASTTAVAPVSYRTTRVQPGDVVQTVSATGPLSAVSTVEVGSQVSGNIARLHVDFNDRVSAGQLIAEIDPSTYEARLVQAEGDLLNARVALELKELNARRTQELFSRLLVAQSELDQTLTELRQQQAIVQVREATVKSARVDLERTKIRSPIAGVVIDRAIDVGQTVQASFAAPTLFRLAHDLREMKITANVSEADVGGVQPGQLVAFSVDAFPGRTFTGIVREVRNNTTLTNNVVTYPTIITVENPDLKLRPGMTANVAITLARRANVKRVPNAALRFRPADAPVAPVASLAAAEGRRTLYLVRGDVDANGRTTGPIEPVTVQTGLSDSAHTEILSGLDEGAVVVVGTALLPDTGTGSGSVSNPFVPKMPGPRGGRH